MIQTRPSSRRPTVAVSRTLAPNYCSSTTYLLAQTAFPPLNGIDPVQDDDTVEDNAEHGESDLVDVAIIGAGLGGLCAGAILNTLYGKKVGIYESHYLPGGCAHAFTRKSSSKSGGQTFVLDSGPTILLGCTVQEGQLPNPLQQVLQAIGRDKDVQWIPYNGWGMVEHPPRENNLDDSSNTVRWKVELGPSKFQEGPLRQFGGPRAELEYQQLQEITKPLLAGANIPTMAMRSGPSALIPLLLRHFSTLVQLIQQGPESTTGTFAPYMDGPIFTVTDPWLRNWLDALAFSLSGLPASRTAAAAMAFTLSDMHKADGKASLDYPAGGIGSIVDALVRGVEQGSNLSKVHLRSHVERIEFSENGKRAAGITLASGRRVVAKDGVICNAPVWSFRGLIKHHPKAMNVLAAKKQLAESINATTNPFKAPSRRTSWIMKNNYQQADGKATASIRAKRPSSWDWDTTPSEATEPEALSLLDRCDLAEQTGSFLHLHLALNASGLDMSQMEAHYTVMDRGLSGDASFQEDDGPCGELNMIAVSNPCKLDPNLAPPGTIVIHAYGAGNEPYEFWQGMDRQSAEYQQLKLKRAQVLWRAVESIVPDAKDRALLELIGSPLTHERFLRRPEGTYGSATEDYLKDGATPISNLVLTGDGIFPGIGLPAVAISGASAANSLINPFQHLQCLAQLDNSAKGQQQFW
ncbi:hypothetical protein ACA910_022238 [Epithemia clementina (nom. ined.)]